MSENSLRIINLSLDHNAINNDSSVYKRILKYSELSQKYDVICLSNNNTKIEIKNGFIYGLKRGNKVFSWLKLFIFTYRKCLENNYNILTVQDPYFIGFLGLVISKIFKLKLEIQVHGWEKFNFFRRMIAYFVIRQADSLRVVSKRLQKQIIEEYRIDSSKIFVAPIVIESIYSLTENKNEFLPREDFIFLTAGRLVKVKNIALQIRAIKKLHDEGIKVRLVIAGYGPEELNLKKLAKELSISDRIIFLGWLNNLRDFYSQGDAFLLTSNSEGWGMVVIEAAQFGLPIIMTDVGCAQEVIVNNESGLVIPVGNLDFLVSRMKRLIENDDLRKKLSIAAIEAVKSLPNEKELLNLQKERWKQLIKKRPLKLLILTQKVDIKDSILGFFHAWIEEFSKHCQNVTVICLERGEYNLPENVKVFSLGKEDGKSRIKYIFNFYKIIWRERRNYDKVFVHMNPIYVVLGCFFWKLCNKKIFLWYTHKKVDFKLIFAEKMVKNIFSASRESFRLKSKKVIITGHGIDSYKFNNNKIFINKDIRIVTAGRITETKKIMSLLEIVKEIRDCGVSVKLYLAGSPITKEDKQYKNKLVDFITSNNIDEVVFLQGDVEHSKIPDFYSQGNIFINLSHTGSLDKAVLEAMSMGLDVFSSNEAFANILGDNFLDSLSTSEIAIKIINKKIEKREDFISYVRKNHDLHKLIKRICLIMN